MKIPLRLTSGSLGSQTPAQASGNYDFVNDVPIQGPTDPGIRAADCWWTQNVLPVKKPACVDCQGPVPTWARNPSAWGGGPAVYGGNGTPCGWGKEMIRYNGRGFTLGAAGDPTTTLTPEQATWVNHTLGKLNHRITATTRSSCAGWQRPSANLAAAVTCFQGWYNANSQGSLRTDGVLDQDTLNALTGTAAAHPTDFTTPFPAASAVPPSAPPPVPVAPPVAPASVPEPPPVVPATSIVSALPKLSTNAMIGIGVASAIVVGGVVYVATRKRSG